MQDLFDYVLDRGVKVENRNSGEREQDGTYVRGRDEREVVATLDLRSYVVKAMETRWVVMSLAADKNGTNYQLVVQKGKQTIFEARRDGEVTSSNFGPEERYIGTTTIPATEWEVVRGQLPKELEVIPTS